MDEIAGYISAKKMELTVALGGSTSFDIYPDGWNKTYGLKHYKDKRVFFVGKIYRDSTGVMTFVNMFTVVFD